MKVMLNHALPNTSVQPAASALLMLGSLFFLAMFSYNLWIAQAKADNQHVLQQLISRQQPAQQPLRSKLTDVQRSTQQEVDIALNELMLPWHAMFKGLETANHEGIQLLAVEPSAKTSLVRIRAVAVDTDSMMHYLDNLTQQASLQQVRLVSHQVVEVHGRPAVELVAEAVWKS